MAGFGAAGMNGEIVFPLLFRVAFHHRGLFFRSSQKKPGRGTRLALVVMR